MDNNKQNLTNEINRLKEESLIRKETLSSIAELIKKEIDRDFRIDLWELSIKNWTTKWPAG